MPKGVVPPEIVAYVRRTFVRETEHLAGLREETAALPNAGMQIEPEQGQFLALLVKSIGAVKTLEVGVFTGYSTLWTASALPEDGKHVALELDEGITRMGVKYWEAAGVSHKIDLRIGPGVESMDRLLAEGHQFDFCFIDADKPNYCNYFERAVQLVRPGGLIAVDNTVWSGQILDDSDMSEGTVAIRQLNELVANDPRVDAILVPIGDGMSLARKK